MMTVLLALNSQADEAQCRDVLRKCDAALQAEIELNKTLETIVKDQSTVIELQKEQIDSQSIWKPIAIGAGIVVGIETIILILRK